MKFLINKIYGYFVNLSKIFSRKNLNNFIYKKLSNEKKLNKVLLIGSTGRFNDLLIKISKEKSFENPAEEKANSDEIDWLVFVLSKIKN